MFDQKGKKVALLIAILIGATLIAIPFVLAGTLVVGDFDATVKYGSGEVSLNGTNSVIIYPHSDTTQSIGAGAAKGWFYFNITGNLAGKTITFYVDHSKPGRMSAHAIFPVVSEDGPMYRTWSYLDSPTEYVEDSDTTWSKGTYSFTSDSALIAAYLPNFYEDDGDADYDDLVDYLDSIDDYSYVDVDSWTSEHDGNNVYLVTVGSNYQSPTIWINAQQHASELWGGITARGILEEFVSDSAYYDNYVLKMIPIVNVDGVSLGLTRLTQTGYNQYDKHDLNRQWDSGDHTYSELEGIMNSIEAWLDAGYSIDVMWDMHVNYQKAEVVGWSATTSSVSYTYVNTYDGTRETMGNNYHNWTMIDYLYDNLVSDTYYADTFGGANPSPTSAFADRMAGYFRADYGAIPYATMEMPQALNVLDPDGTVEANYANIKAHGEALLESVIESFEAKFNPEYDYGTNYMDKTAWEDFYGDLQTNLTTVVSDTFELRTGTFYEDCDLYWTGSTWIERIFTNNVPEIDIGNYTDPFKAYNSTLLIRFPYVGAMMPSNTSRITITDATLKLRIVNNGTQEDIHVDIHGLTDDAPIRAHMETRAHTTESVGYELGNYTSYTWLNIDGLEDIITELLLTENLDSIVLEIEPDEETPVGYTKTVAMYERGAGPRLEISWTYDASDILDAMPDQTQAQWEAYYTSTIVPAMINIDSKDSEDVRISTKYYDQEITSSDASSWSYDIYEDEAPIGYDAPDYGAIAMRWPNYRVMAPVGFIDITEAKLWGKFINSEGGANTTTASITAVLDGATLSQNNFMSRTRTATNGSWIIPSEPSWGSDYSENFITTFEELINETSFEDGHVCLGLEYYNIGSDNEKLMTSFDRGGADGAGLSVIYNFTLEEWIADALAAYKVANEYD